MLTSCIEVRAGCVLGTSRIVTRFSEGVGNVPALSGVLWYKSSKMEGLFELVGVLVFAAGVWYVVHWPIAKLLDRLDADGRIGAGRRWRRQYGPGWRYYRAKYTGR